MIDADALKINNGWIPFVKRPLTGDEKKTHPDWCYILEGNVPEDEEEILLYRPWKNSKGYIITMDQYMNNGNECYLDGAGDIENGMFWMPLPEPPKEEKDDAGNKKCFSGRQAMDNDKICELLNEISLYFYQCYRNAGGGTRACEKFHDYMCAVDEAKNLITRTDNTFSKPIAQSATDYSGIMCE